ncbi:hypothetical protein [Aquiflexum sp.]|uniref:hypothetical protein n=1 Tax=Aquiflexum sp. TaxID=1872584 RepID=UPI0035933778
MKDSLTAIGFSIVNSWENWLEIISKPEIDFYTRIYSRNQIPKVVMQPDFLFSRFNMDSLQIDYQDLLMLPWPFSGNFHKSQDQFPNNNFEMDERNAAESQSGHFPFQAIKTGVHKTQHQSADISKQDIERSGSIYFSSKNLAPIKASAFKKISVNNKGVNNENTEKQEFKKRYGIQDDEALSEKRKLDSWDDPIEISEMEQVNEVQGDWEKDVNERTENPITLIKNRHSPKAEDATYFENIPDPPLFKPNVSGYGHPIWQSAADKKQENSVFSPVKGWGDLAERLNDQSQNGNNPDLTSSEDDVSSIIETDVRQSFPQTSGKSLSKDTYSAFRNLTVVEKEISTQHLPFTSKDMAMETPQLSESETISTDKE